MFAVQHHWDMWIWIIEMKQSQSFTMASMGKIK
jgi:hypothetical protein